jgi:hypothetical protein
MKAYGSGGIDPQILTSALDCEWLVSHPGHFTPGERAPAAHWTGGWVDPRAGLDGVEWKISLSLARNRTPAVRSIARHYTDWASS